MRDAVGFVVFCAGVVAVGELAWRLLGAVVILLWSGISGLVRGRRSSC